MNLKSSLITATVVVSALVTPTGDASEEPMAKKVPHEMTLHGTTRVDNYLLAAR